MLDAVADYAGKLSGAASATIYLVEGDVLRRAAASGPQAPGDGAAEEVPIDAASVAGRCATARDTVHVPDLDAQPELADAESRRLGVRALLATPLLRRDLAIGVIVLRRTEPRAFAPREIDWLRTFSDQAAIAIDNARLF